MSTLQKFLFDGLPVRGAVVQLDDAWREVVQRRAAHPQTGAYPDAVTQLLGEMTAAACLMQANIKFHGALLLQMQGDGAVQMAVAEVQSDLALRATATVLGDVPAQATLAQMVNPQGHGRCAITLDPQRRMPGQQPYQGIVPLVDAQGQPLPNVAQVLQHYMRQSEQLDTTLVLAANAHAAAGVLIQRLPLEGEANLAGSTQAAADDAQRAAHEHFQRLSTLAQSLQAQELLELDADTILHRLFWNEPLLRFAPTATDPIPHFACTCSRARVQQMIHSLGQAEAHSIVQEQGHIEVGCEFCGQHYLFDAVELAHLFTPAAQQAPGSPLMQ